MKQLCSSNPTSWPWAEICLGDGSYFRWCSLVFQLIFLRIQGLMIVSDVLTTVAWPQSSGRGTACEEQTNLRTNWRRRRKRMRKPFLAWLVAFVSLFFFSGMFVALGQHRLAKATCKTDRMRFDISKIIVNQSGCWFSVGVSKFTCF